MPYFDGTGPDGRGPMTGRGLGPCGRGYGFGRGARFGYGWGRQGMSARRFFPFWRQAPVDSRGVLDEKKELELNAEELEAELADIRARLDELNKKER